MKENGLRHTRLRKVRVLAAMVVALAMSLTAAAGSGRTKKRDSVIAFSTDLEKALEQAKATDTPVCLAFGAIWCPVCRHLKDVTLMEPPMQALADDFIWVFIDIDRKLSLAREWELEATPTIFLLDSAGYSRRKIVGGASADELSATLRQFLADLGAEAATGVPAMAEVYRHTALTSKPGGFRGKSICFSHVGYGPLKIRSQSAFQSLRLGIVPRTPSTLARGEQEVRLGATWANNWANDAASFDPENGEIGPYLLDFEALDLGLSYAYGITDTFQIEAEYEQRVRFGGRLDSLIEGFHNLFGLGQAGRDLWPRDQLNIFVDPGDGRPPVVLGSEARGTFARNLLVTLQHNITCGTAKLPALSWAVTGRYAAGNFDDLEGGNFDLALSVAAARRFGHFYVYLTLGYAWYGSDSVYGLDLESTQATVLAAGEWRFKPRMSLILQYLVSQGVATDLGPFSDTSNEVVFGFKWEVHSAGVLEIGLLENIISFDNSPDFGVHAAFTQRF
ncbi:MAG: DUF3187 family protein [Thermoanaerobaculales bacterium]